MMNEYLKRHFEVHKLETLSTFAPNEFTIIIPHETVVAMLSKYVEDVRIRDSVKNQSLAVGYIEGGKIFNREYYTPLDVLEDVLRLQSEAYPEEMYENGISTYNVIEVYGTLDPSGASFVIKDSGTDKLSILYYINCGITQEYIDASKPWVTYVADILPTFSYAMYVAGDRNWDVGKLVTGLEGKVAHPDEADEENAELSAGEFDEKFGPSGYAWKR